MDRLLVPFRPPVAEGEPAARGSGPGLLAAHFLVALFGFLLGIVATDVVLSHPFDFSEELREARRLGMVSATILAGYPKSKDILTYVCAFGLPAIFSVGTWALWVRGRRGPLAPMLEEPGDSEGEQGRGLRRIVLALTLLVCLAIPFNVNQLLRPESASRGVSFNFFFEEGMNLSISARIRSGEVYGRDFFGGYGPTMFHSLAAFQEVFGASVLTARIHRWLLDLASYAIVIWLLWGSIRSRVLFATASIAYVLLFPVFSPLAAHVSLLRVTFGLVPVVLWSRELEAERWLWGRSILAGLLLGQSLLFSQEAGLCAALAMAAMTIVRFLARGWPTGFFRSTSAAAAGLTISLGSFFGWLAWKGALTATIHDLWLLPKQFALGMGALPFPDFRQFLRAPFDGDSIFPFAVVLLYAAAAFWLLSRLLTGTLGPRRLLASGLLVFGALLFRKALGRSGMEHVHFCAPPAFLIASLWIDEAVARVRDRRPAAWHRRQGWIPIATILGSALLVVGTTDWFRAIVEAQRTEFGRFSTKWRPMELGVRFPALDRLGTFVDPRTADTLALIGSFLGSRTRSDDFVFFFPYEAGYYFLFDRKCPTRWVIPIPPTRETRMEVLRDLEKNRPEWVVYSTGNRGLDSMPESLTAPELLDYFHRNYDLDTRLGDILMLRRKR